MIFQVGTYESLVVTTVYFWLGMYYVVKNNVTILESLPTAQIELTSVCLSLCGKC